MIKIAPSILSADFTRLGDEVKAVEEAGADYIHIDVMDGHFVPNITIGPMIVEAVKRVTELPLDVHLMISDPDKYIDEFSRAGADILTIHQEACLHLHRSIHYIKDRGIKAGVSLNPATPVNTIEYVLQDIDLVLIMTVNPGFGGQKFIPEIVPKITQLKNIIKSSGYNTLIEVDGGIGPDTVKVVSSAGADIVVAGSAIFNSRNYKETISLMRKNANTD